MFNKSIFMALALIISSQAHAAITLYCNGMGDAKSYSETITLESVNQVVIDNNAYELDRSYNPRLNLGFLRYENPDSDEGTQEVLVQEQLLEGAERGMIKTQSRSPDGFSTLSYYCHP